MTSKTYTVQEAAHILGVGQRELFRYLREHRVIDAGNIPYSYYLDNGLMKVRYSSWAKPGDRRAHHHARPLVTPRGLDWLRGRLAEERKAS